MDGWLGADAAYKLDIRRSTCHSVPEDSHNNPIDVEFETFDLEYGGIARYHHALVPTATDAKSSYFLITEKVRQG